MTTSLSWTDARRIALRSQGMGPARRTAPGTLRESTAALARTLERTHLLQIDSVSVFARAHHMPVYTRTGSWDIRALDRAARPGEGRLLHEALAHEATFVDEEVHALLAFRRRRVAQRDWGRIRAAADGGGELLGRIRELLEREGPLSAAAISAGLGDTERGEGWGWRRTSTQWTVEYLFRTGALDCVGRSTQFERLYVPCPEHEAWQGAPAPAGDEGSAAPHELAATRDLVERAARALGVADVAALADYFRLRVRDTAPAVRELIEDGTLQEVRIAHPAGPLTWLRHRDAPDPAPLRSAALVSPFDPIVFFRPRLSTLFDVDYRIGIYTPAAQRTTGYYSLPFLLGDRIVARIDLRADRARGMLQVRGIYPEPLPHLRGRHHPGPERIAEALGGELSRAARWQGLEGIEMQHGSADPEAAELGGALAETLRAA